MPGGKFIKTWRLKNPGNCTWTSGYSLVFDSDDLLGVPLTPQLMTCTVAQDVGNAVPITLEETSDVLWIIL